MSKEKKKGKMKFHKKKNQKCIFVELRFETKQTFKAFSSILYWGTQWRSINPILGRPLHFEHELDITFSLNTKPIQIKNKVYNCLIIPKF